MILNGTHVGGGNYTISSSSAAFANGAALGGTGIVSATVANFNDASFLSPGGAFSVGWRTVPRFRKPRAS